MVLLHCIIPTRSETSKHNSKKYKHCYGYVTSWCRPSSYLGLQPKWAGLKKNSNSSLDVHSQTSYTAVRSMSNVLATWTLPSSTSVASVWKSDLGKHENGECINAGLMVRFGQTTRYLALSLRELHDCNLCLMGQCRQIKRRVTIPSVFAIMAISVMLGF